MFFGSLAPLEAENGVLAHQARAGEVVFKKGYRLSLADCTVLAAAGVKQVSVARLDADDMDENAAAAALARAAAGQGVRVDEAFTGRANLFAAHNGVLAIDGARIDAFNQLDEGMALATLPAFRVVALGEMIGTVKIIPFALPGALVDRGAQHLGGAMQVMPFTGLRVGVLSLTLPGLKPAVIEKTLRVTAARLTPLAASIAFELRLAHDEEALVAALAALDPANFDLLLIFGAAAISDRRDVIPRAIEQVGGRNLHLGMPVDPGNLLLLAEAFGRPVIGAPGCARSPRRNGFDFVLERLAACLPVSAADIQGMGVGGLLMEIGTRPQPRAGTP